MSAKVQFVAVERLGAADDTYKITTTNGTKGVSMSIERWLTGDRTVVEFDPEDALRLANTLIAKAINVMNQRRDNEGAL